MTISVAQEKILSTKDIQTTTTHPYNLCHTENLKPPRFKTQKNESKIFDHMSKT